jgi:hypothetical protein
MSIGAKFILLAAVLCTSGFTQTAAANLRDSSKPFEDERHHGRRAVGVEGAAEESTTRPTPTKKTRALSTASYTGTNTWGSGSWACRGAGGAGAPNDPNWNLYFDLATGSAKYSSSACQAACDAASTNCVGYEFSAQYARCELWKVPITNNKSLNWGDFDCMTKAPQVDMPVDIISGYTGTNNSGGSWACRGAGGGGAPNDPNWNLYFDLATGSAQYSSSACQAACDAASTNCVGYEFSAQYARCELWKVPITDYHYLDWGDFDCMTKAPQVVGDMCSPNSCGVSSATSPNGSCYCDDVCKQYNDCCTNYDAVC